MALERTIKRGGEMTKLKIISFYNLVLHGWPNENKTTLTEQPISDIIALRNDKKS